MALFPAARRLSAVTFLFLMLPALAACTGADQAGPACPRVRVPTEVGTLTRFAPGGGVDITDVTFESELVSVRGECTVDDEEVEVPLLIEFGSRLGPAAESRTVPVELFVAVTDLQRNVLSRRALSYELRFPAGQLTVGRQQRLVVDIPKSETQRGDSFLIFVGYVLSDEELAFNRAQLR